jgi:hypothetical protein
MYSSSVPFFFFFFKFPAENYDDMYILGFIFLFIGLSLLLYTILLIIHFFWDNSKKKEILEAKKDKPTIENFSQKMIEDPILPKNKEQVQNDYIEEKEKKESLIHQNQKTKSNIHKPTTVQKELKEKFLDLYLTGYLYYDPTKSTYILFEKFDKTPSDYLSNLNRLGNATIEWKNDGFIINYDENTIYLKYQNLKEIRFSDECAAFISKNNTEPYYYFFSNQILQLKNFLKQWTNDS